MSKESIKLHKFALKESSHRAFESLPKEISKTVLTTLVTLALTLFGNMVFNNHAIVYNDFNVLEKSVRDIFSEDEFLYGTCASESDLKQQQVLEDVKSLRLSLQVLLDQHASMGKIISRETYCQIHAFTAYNNIAQLLQGDACSSRLKNTAELDAWQSQIVDSIKQEQSSHVGAISALKDYFNIRLRGQEHSPKECGLS